MTVVPFPMLIFQPALLLIFPVFLALRYVLYTPYQIIPSLHSSLRSYLFFGIAWISSKLLFSCCLPAIRWSDLPISWVLLRFCECRLAMQPLRSDFILDSNILLTKSLETLLNLRFCSFLHAIFRAWVA